MYLQDTCVFAVYTKVRAYEREPIGKRGLEPYDFLGGESCVQCIYMPVVNGSTVAPYVLVGCCSTYIYIYICSCLGEGFHK